MAWGQVLDHHDWKRPKHRLRSGLRRADVGDVALSVRNPGIGALATTHHQQQQVVVGAIFIEFVPNIADQISKAAPSAIYGIVLIACVYAMPMGVAGGLRFVAARAARLASERPPR